jgi:hypothetical protein
MIKGRRSVRVLARIPVSLMVGDDPPEHGVTAVVNRHGALLLSPIRCEEGITLTIRNELSSETTRCRVTWIGSMDASGGHKLGVEFVDEAPRFWGGAYEKAVKAAEADDASDLNRSNVSR